LALWAVDLQCRRLQTEEPEDKDFVFRKWADFDFLMVALTRLRRAAKLASGIPDCQQSLVPALAEFDASLSALKKLRDVAEHVDDYAIDGGRDRSIKRQALEVSVLSMGGSTLEWLGHEMNSDEALKAGQKLFDAIREASGGFAQRAQQGVQPDGPASSGPAG